MGRWKPRTKHHWVLNREKVFIYLLLGEMESKTVKRQASPSVSLGKTEMCYPGAGVGGGVAPYKLDGGSVGFML